ncbi:protein translocase subunit SecD [Anaeromicropila populeti]|uniref:Multifunctional fusion protein n=1 Tax=Anaeromicropila populeti TaxID=37658 RepID=A0A1I6IQQ7_9FIRM|nr:protein translocase subunit SecD [Anaeromicropila populeti]SFR69087.1 protein translocase subunit secF/protein translocase subunit secD [Anaeromicropila populeti]
MKDKKRGIASLLLVVIVIGAFSAIAFMGIGKQHKGSAQNIKLGLDLAGGVSITYETVDDNPTATEMKDTIYKLQKRVENYSMEAAVYQEGSNRINVDIPGVTNANEILAALGKAGSIEFKDEDGNVVIDGSDISTAKAGTITQGLTEYVVNLELNATGANKFAEATAANIGKTISIVYDGEVISSPKVNEAITGGKAQISGQSSYDEAEALASTIRIGALPLELKEVRSNVVGARLGEEAVDTSLLAGIIGLAIVLLFMIAYYRIPGLASAIALCLYVVVTLVVLNGFNVTLTLPGIAGIILSIGMAVDANVVIFTRIREELATGKTVRSAIKLGFDKALSAIIDGNVTTLIAAAVLYFKGSGTVKGFAQTLAIGIILSMFTALTVTKFILKGLYGIGFDKEKFYGVQKEVKVKNFTGNFLKFASISGVIILVGIGSLIYNKAQTGQILNYGLDFKGGTSTEVTFEGTVPSSTEIRELVKTVTGKNAETSEVKGENAVVIKTQELSLDERTALENKLVETYSVDKNKIQTENISGAISDEMKEDAVVAVIIATICMLIYIWFRFKDANFGASAVLALCHDVLIVITVYAVASAMNRISVSSTFIACMLTIVGYSINATIIVFDRIRENKGTMNRPDLLENVVNTSVSQTISRNINTSLTTFVMVLVLAILGVDSIQEFAIPIMAGIIGGAYSSICITGALWFVLKKTFTKKKA